MRKAADYLLRGAAGAIIGLLITSCIAGSIVQDLLNVESWLSFYPLCSPIIILLGGFVGLCIGLWTARANAGR